MSNITELAGYPEVSFIENLTADQLLQNVIADYKQYMGEATGVTPELSAADPVRVMLYAFAGWQYQAFKYLDEGCKSGLLKYSTGAWLDNLGALRGIKRFTAQPATTKVKFTLSDIRASATGIAGGTRISAGSIYFATDEYLEIPAGQQVGEVSATALVAGLDGNGLRAGDINKLVDLVPYVQSVANTTLSAGGTNAESDDSLTLRIYQSPAGYSVAGPHDAYVYHARQAIADMGDVAVWSPEAGTVQVLFTMSDGSIPESDKLEAVEDYLSADTIRPLTDTVEVVAPTEEEYTVNLKYYINKADSAIATEIQTQVGDAVTAYTQWQRKIGRDLSPSKLIAMIMAAGAKRVEVTAPVHTVIGAHNIAKCTAKTVTYGGLEDD